MRAQFSDPLNIEIGARSLRAYQDFARRPGADIDLRQVGYLFLLAEQQQAAAFESAVATQRELGVPSRMISPARARALCPYLDTGELVAGAFCGTDGHARPGAVVHGYLRAARELGTRVRTHCAVTGIETSGERITAVRTSAGTVRTGAVICTAGAWSGSVGSMASVRLPVRPLRRQVAFTEPVSPPPPRIPFTIDFSSTAYFHNAGDGLLLGLSDPAQPEGFDTRYTEEWLPLFREVARRRAPEIAELPVTGGWAGLYELTPDHNALIGEAPSVHRFLYATGFSGHGFLQAPAVGEIVRDLYLGRTPPVDVTALTANRFAPGATTIRPEAHIV